MAQKFHYVRFGLAIDTLENWTKSTKILLKGEPAIVLPSGDEVAPRIKIGDGVNTFSQLTWMTNTPKELNDAIAAAIQTAQQGVISQFTNKEILDAIEVALTNSLKQNYDAAYTHSQLPHAPANAQENVIEKVKVNGAEVTASNKEVDITVPTKVSELTNDAGYLTEESDTTYTLDTVASQPNDSVQIKLTPSEGEADVVAISGTGSTTVTTDENGKIIIDTNVDGYDDTEIKNRISANESAIETLNGTGVGSVSKTVADEIAKVVGEAPESLDTLKEISDWISSHSESAAAMNSAIQGNTTSITNLAKLVGSLPEGATSNNVVAYIAEAIGVSKTELEGAIATAKSEAIAAAAADATSKANTAETNAKSYADGLASNYATAEQGTKADTAIQGVKVAGTEVVKDSENKINITEISMDMLVDGADEFIILGGGAGVENA